MGGIIFLEGETKIRPGVYIRTTKVGLSEGAVVSQGVAAVLFRSSWGPLNQVVDLEAAEEAKNIFGTSGTVAAITEVFRGGARRVKAFRLGTGGEKGKVNLQDTEETPVDVVQIEAKYPGGKELNATIRESLVDDSQKELLIYEGFTLADKFSFAAGGVNEPQNLVDAVNTQGSAWIAAAKLADGNGTVAQVSQEDLTGGADPAVAGTEYEAGLAALEIESWNVLAVDSEDAAVHAAVQTYIDRVRGEGKRVRAVLGEGTGVALATRLTNAQAFNDLAITYVANGFKNSAGTEITGYPAAARMAGKSAAAGITRSLTHEVIEGAVDVAGKLTNAEVEEAVQSGALVFTANSSGQVQVEYDINTLVTLDADQDAGWRKNRRVRTRDNLIDRIVAAWDPLIGKVNNSPDGRATLIAAAQDIVNKMIGEGALVSGTVKLDETNLPAGDSAWFVIEELADLDSTEKIYLTVGFQF
ncbi:MAG: phage tail sheath subtilisin-like domain-containing protein [Peptococcaceae bacterium]